MCAHICALGRAPSQSRHCIPLFLALAPNMQTCSFQAPVSHHVVISANFTAAALFTRVHLRSERGLHLRDSIHAAIASAQRFVLTSNPQLGRYTSCAQESSAHTFAAFYVRNFSGVYMVTTLGKSQTHGYRQRTCTAADWPISNLHSCCSSVRLRKGVPHWTSTRAHKFL